MVHRASFVDHLHTNIAALRPLEMAQRQEWQAIANSKLARTCSESSVALELKEVDIAQSSVSCTWR